MLSSFETAALVANAADSKKALNIDVLEVGPISSVADYFVVCTGESVAQIRAIADHIDTTLKKMGQAPIGQERDRIGKWYLLDYGDVIVHVLHPQAREYYQIEHFWNHAHPLPKEQWMAKEQRQAS